MADDWDNCEGDYGKPLTELQPEDILNMSFVSLHEVEKFYVMLSKCLGFGYRIRDGKSPDGVIVWRKWVCNKEGFREQKHNDRTDRQRKPKRVTRCGCKACLRTKLFPSTNTWRIVKFNPIHNHNLVPTEMSHLLRSHRIVTQCDISQINSLRFVGVRPCQIYQLLKHQSGGANRVGCTDKDLRNFMARNHAKEMMEGDFRKTVGYFEHKQVVDPGFFFRYTRNDTDGQWENIFWCDTHSRIDFQSFGDVMTFDSTHSTNIYRKPMVLFIGVNSHHLTCIFGCALLEHETKESYKWLLGVLLEAMGGDKIPETVITDGDLAMRVALREVYGDDCKHRLCSWHLARSVKTNMADRKDFEDRFYLCMKTTSKDEFEEQWHQLQEDFDIKDKTWAINLYETKEMWCVAYLNNHFWAGQHANSRSESINFTAKHYLDVKNTLYLMVRHFEDVLEHQRERERMEQYDTVYTSPALPMTALAQIESQAARIYTKASFSVFCMELISLGSVIVRPRRNEGYIYPYTVSWYPEKNSSYDVIFDYKSKVVMCSCKRFEQYGFLCRHSLAVYQYNLFYELPKSCFLKRWTRDVKDVVYYASTQTIPESEVIVFREASLAGMCREMVHLGGKTPARFNQVRSVISDVMNELNKEDVPGPSQTQGLQSAENVNSTGGVRINKKTHACSKCGQTGHNRKTCKQPPDGSGPSQ